MSDQNTKRFAFGFKLPAGFSTAVFKRLRCSQMDEKNRQLSTFTLKSTLGKIMNFLVKTLASSCIVVTLAGCGGHPILNIQGEAVPSRLDGSAQTKKAVKKSILAGCFERKGWNCRKVAPGQILASINVREHHAEVNIKYDRDSYSITYKDSEMLDYNEKRNTIHRNYNRWINNLNNAIINQLMDKQAK